MYSMAKVKRWLLPGNLSGLEQPDLGRLRFPLRFKVKLQIEISKAKGETCLARGLFASRLTPDREWELAWNEEMGRAFSSECGRWKALSSGQSAQWRIA
jgi:hypothetical protein